MKAIIISAGKGERLYPLTKNTPKSLLEVGDGLTMLETQLHSLSANNIRDIVIVTGFKAEQIEAKIKEYQQSLNITTVFNPFFDISNNLISVWMARHHMTSDFITINGDDIFSETVIENLLKSPHDITMVIDEKKSYDDDDMKVIHQNGEILEVNKKIDPLKANGESIGIIKYSNKGPRIFVEMLDSMVRDLQNRNLFYLQAIQNIIDKGFKVHYSLCQESDWAELDFHPDLKLIRTYLSRYKLLDNLTITSLTKPMV
jgi:L-glutamine-phosphate cytidylyltransferase